MDLLKRQAELDNAKKKLFSGSADNGKKSPNKLNARQRLSNLFDADTFCETAAYIKPRQNEFLTANCEDYEGIICGYGSVDGRLVFAFSQESMRNNGAFGKAAADKICALIDMAKKNAAPVVAVFDSNGARISEGLDVLDGYGRVMKKISSVKGKIPVISCICGNTSGANAIIACLADVVVSVHDGAALSLSPLSVLQNNAQNNEFNCDKSAVSVYVQNENEVFAAVRDILYYLPSNKLDRNIYTEVIDNPERLTPEISAIVTADNYDMHNVINALADGARYLELNKDSGRGIITAFCVLNGLPCGIVANTGKDLCAGSMTKASSFIKLCNCFEIPVLTLVDCKGFSVDCEAKGNKLLSACSSLAAAYTTSTIPLITVVLGKAYGSVFTLMGSKSLGADVVFALNSSEISVMNPQSGVVFMWNDKLAQGKSKAELEELWKTNASNPLTAANYGYVDDIVSADILRKKILSSMEMLSMKSEFSTLF